MNTVQILFVEDAAYGSKITPL